MGAVLRCRNQDWINFAPVGSAGWCPGRNFFSRNKKNFRGANTLHIRANLALARLRRLPRRSVDAGPRGESEAAAVRTALGRAGVGYFVLHLVLKYAIAVA